MVANAQSVDILLKKLNSDSKIGLSTDEAKKRLKEYGYNEVPEKKPSYILLFLKKFWGPSAWMLELIILLSWFLQRLLDFSIVLALLIFNAIISFIQQLMATNALESLKKKLSITSRVLREGTWTPIPSRELVPGDIISIKMGDFVPADMKIITGTVQIDQSILTGESLTIEKKSNDLVYSGSTVTMGQSSGLVVETGLKTYFGKTLELVETTVPVSHAEAIIGNITKWLFSIVATIIILLFIISFIKGINLLETLPLLLVLLLSGIPVALAPMFTISMALGAKELSKKNVLTTRLEAIEEAAAMNVLCIDKTGTITLNKLAVSAIHPFGNYSENDVLLYAALASQAATLDQIDMAFLAAAHEKKLPLNSYTVKHFIPFNSKTKRTEALVQQDGKEFTVYKGALDSLEISINTTEEKRMVDAYLSNEFAQKGYRAIAIAKTMDAKTVLVGLVGLEDPPWPQAENVIAEIKNLHVKIKLLTGDALAIANEIARRVGLLKDSVTTVSPKTAGQENGLTTDIILKNTIFAEIYPEDKFNIVKTLQEHGDIVGMTGDGVNDAPALAQAEVGIAVSAATDVAKKAAGIVLTKPGLYSIKELITIGRLVFQRVHTWVLNKISRTVLKTGYILIAFLTTGQYVITASEMLLLVFMTDFVKLSLATDNETISKTPCNWNIPNLSRLAILLGIVMIIEACGLLYIGIHHLHISGLDLHSYSFLILFFMAIFSIFVVRERGNFWDSAPSKTLLISIACAVIFSSTIISFGLLGFKALPIRYTLFVALYACIFSLFVNNGIKRLAQKMTMNRS